MTYKSFSQTRGQNEEYHNQQYNQNPHFNTKMGVTSVDQLPLQHNIQSDILPNGVRIKSVHDHLQRNVNHDFNSQPNIENHNIFRWAEKSSSHGQGGPPHDYNPSNFTPIQQLPQKPSSPLLQQQQLAQLLSQIDCKMIMNHIEKCKICSKVYKHDENKYIMTIIVLVLIIIYLLTKIIDKHN